jgi:hypothetical protein
MNRRKLRSHRINLQRTGLYHYRDRLTGLSLAGKVLVKQQGSGTVSPKLKFEQPIRLLIEVQTQSPMAKRPEIRIHQFAPSRG